MSAPAVAAKKKLKIALISETFPPRESGISTSVANLAEGLRSLDHEVRIFCYLDGIGRADTPEVVGRTIPWKYETYIHKFLRFVDLFRGRKSRPDPTARYARAFFGGICGRLLKKPLEDFDPDIVVVPDHNAPTARLSLPDKARVIFVAHHNAARYADNPDVSDTTMAEMAPVVGLEQKGLDNCDAAICVCEYMKGVFEETYKFKGAVKVLPNLVAKEVADHQPSDIRAKLELPPGTPLVYIPSAYSRLKGADWLKEIVTKIASGYKKPVAFYLSGRHASEIPRLGGIVPSNAIIFDPGAVPYNENMSHVKASDICVSAVVVENFSMAMLEAQFLGIPIVTWDVGGQKEIVIDGETGYVVAYRDIDALVARALTLLNDPSLRDRMSVAAENRAETTFNQRLVSINYEKFFYELLDPVANSNGKAPLNRKHG